MLNLISCARMSRIAACPGEFVMKLQLITTGIIAYTILTMAWICYAELAFP
jgi:hypothetical protein